ncbi:hypothetical protein O9992_27155 [Vibrio lentus]|nr:hypothetical protein [Vibrio lentus]
MRRFSLAMLMNITAAILRMGKLRSVAVIMILAGLSAVVLTLPQPFATRKSVVVDMEKTS